MSKPLTLILAALALLAGVAIGLAAAHARRASKPVAQTGVHSSPMESVSLQKSMDAETMPAGKDGETDKDPDDAENVIRFVSNPLPAPAFLLTDLDGNPVSTSQWKGKVVILDFWATWCPPCQAEIPMLVDLQNRYKDRLLIVGVSVDDSPAEDVKQFVKQSGMNYPVVMADRQLVQEYGGVPALPTSFVINEDTKVVQKHVGLFPETMYDQEVRALLNLPIEARVETFEDRGQIFLRNASLATELPGVNFKGLTEAQKKLALRELNTQTCKCGCGLTLAQCRIVDSPCQVSKKLANAVVQKIRSGGGSPTPSAKPQTSDTSQSTPSAQPTAASPIGQ